MSSCARQVPRRRLWPILDRLGILRCGMHAFQHTHASLLVASGASPVVAQWQLRHSDVETTLGHYAHVLPGEKRQAVEQVAEKLRPDVTRVTKSETQSKRNQ